MTHAESFSEGTAKIGGAILQRNEAFAAAKAYFSRDGGHAYPAYDSYEMASDPDCLSDGELLAPVLLNVRPSVQAYYSIQAIRPHLE